MDYTTMTDEGLAEVIAGARIEQERRRNLAQIPDDIASLADTYRKGGGDPSILVQAVEGADQ